MQCYDAESLLIDYLDAQLHPGDKVPLEKHLQSCPYCQKALDEYKLLFTAIENDQAAKPKPTLREKFENMLQSEINVSNTSGMSAIENDDSKIKPLKRSSQLLKIAACIILVASGIFIGTQISFHSSNANNEMISLKTEVKEMKETLLFNLLAQESASERIKAVNYADEIEEPDNKIFSALIATMNEDKNVNVRLAALYAVSKFSDNRKINDALVTSLAKQTEPLMQIALINILTEKKESKAKAPIREILQDEKTLPPVKEIAQKGLKLL